MKSTKSRILVDCGFFSLKEDTLEKPDGQTAIYTSLHFPCNATSIIAQDKEGRFILTKEYRHPVGQTLLGCAGGRLEPGEDPLIGGRRELIEETGYDSSEIRELGVAYPFAGGLNQKVHFLYAPNAVLIRNQKLDPFEKIEVVVKTPKELKKALRSGSPIDGILCTALLYFHEFVAASL